MTTQLEQAWELAKQRFAAVGIDVEEALRQLDRLPVSMHCWQGDDVSGLKGHGTIQIKAASLVRCANTVTPTC